MNKNGGLIVKSKDSRKGRTIDENTRIIMKIIEKDKNMEGRSR